MLPSKTPSGHGSSSHLAYIHGPRYCWGCGTQWLHNIPQPFHCPDCHLGLAVVPNKMAEFLNSKINDNKFSDRFQLNPFKWWISIGCFILGHPKKGKQLEQILVTVQRGVVTQDLLHQCCCKNVGRRRGRPVALEKAHRIALAVGIHEDLPLCWWDGILQTWCTHNWHQKVHNDHKAAHLGTVEAVFLRTSSMRG